MKEKKPKTNCLVCGRDTVARKQVCSRCLGTGFYASKDCAGATVGPNDLLYDEFEHDYSEEALGPHGSDQRWNYAYV